MKPNLLKELYKDRESDIAKLDEVDIQNLKKLLREREIANKQLDTAINNIPDGFKSTINNLNKAIQRKLEVENNIGGYFNEKSYSTGFLDAMKFIMRFIENENRNENKRA